VSERIERGDPYPWSESEDADVPEGEEDDTEMTDEQIDAAARKIRKLMLAKGLIRLEDLPPEDDETKGVPVDPPPADEPPGATPDHDEDDDLDEHFPEDDWEPVTDPDKGHGYPPPPYR